jgi:hypothetical protein
MRECITKHTTLQTNDAYLHGSRNLNASLSKVGCRKRGESARFCKCGVSGMAIRASDPPVASSISFVHAFETVGFAAACASGVSRVSEAFTSGTTNARAPSELSRQRPDESKTHPQGQQWQIEQGRHETFLKKVLGGGEMGISDYPKSHNTILEN